MEIIHYQCSKCGASLINETGVTKLEMLTLEASEVEELIIAREEDWADQLEVHETSCGGSLTEEEITIAC